ncbi:MAG: hypothetical protein SAK29_06045 [Scytonema sp. PMC 1069.18]|nr:hypothetical protein [Scytonema sp. PMC 1069.18]MEC4882381.1 hypothetical protein [Scytonema sp. PMC 1070.18]
MTLLYFVIDSDSTPFLPESLNLSFSSPNRDATSSRWRSLSASEKYTVRGSVPEGRERDAARTILVRDLLRLASRAVAFL